MIVKKMIITILSGVYTVHGCIVIAYCVVIDGFSTLLTDFC